MELVDIIGFEGLYKINKEGQIWGVKRQKFLKLRISKTGYYNIKLCKEGKHKSYVVHRLLCLQFLPNPNNLPLIDHIDHNRSNNNLDNLRWVDSRGNCCNRTIQPRSGETNITIRDRASPYCVCIYFEKQNHIKSFKTIEEAIEYRDNFYRENNLLFLV